MNAKRVLLDDVTGCRILYTFGYDTEKDFACITEKYDATKPKCDNQDIILAACCAWQSVKMRAEAELRIIVVLL